MVTIQWNAHDCLWEAVWNGVVVYRGSYEFVDCALAKRDAKSFGKRLTPRANAYRSASKGE